MNKNKNWKIKEKYQITEAFKVQLYSEVNIDFKIFEGNVSGVHRFWKFGINSSNHVCKDDKL